MTAHMEPVRADSNRRRAQTAVAAVGAVPALLVFVVDALFGHPVIGTVMALAVGVVVAMWAWNGATMRALAGLGATTADPEEHPRLHNLVDGLCAIAGVAKPELHVQPDDRADICSLGVDGQRAHLIVTTGLLRDLTRVELEAVLAHELAHIKQLDIAPATVLAGLAPTVAGPIVRAVIGRRPATDDFGIEPHADLEGVRLTRYPPGLITALEKVAATPREASGDVQYPWLSAEERPDELRFRIDVLREL
jgi:hypothetical protein